MLTQAPTETQSVAENVMNAVSEFDPNPVIESIATWFAAQNEFVILVAYIALALLVFKFCKWLLKTVGKTVAIAVAIAYILTSTTFGATIITYIEKLNLG